MFACVCVCVYMCVYGYMCVCVYVCLCVYVCICMFVFWGAPKSLQMVTAAMKLKDTCSFSSKAMTNLDSTLESRDITFPTKVHLVKALVFPVIMYGCENCIIKKAEH